MASPGQHQPGHGGRLVATLLGVTLVGIGGGSALAAGPADATRPATVTETAVGIGLLGPGPALLPGTGRDSYRTLTNTGEAAQLFTGSVSGSGALAGAGGLTLSVTACSTGWTLPSGRCAGVTRILLAPTAVASGPSVAYGRLAPGQALALRYTVALPVTTPATLAGTTGQVSVAITGGPTG